jgi:hypothetical protein
LVTFRFETGSEGGGVIAIMNGNELAFEAPQLFEFPNDENGDNVYTFNLIASDGGNETVQTFTVTVNEVNFPPELVAEGGFAFENTDDFGGFVDVQDFMDNDDLTVTLTGDDAAFFTIVENGSGPGSFFGDLEFIAAPDFENPGDANGDNTYEFTVEVFDGQNTVTQDVTVVVEDEDENGTVKTAEDSDFGALFADINSELAQEDDLLNSPFTPLVDIAPHDLGTNDALASFSLEDDGAINLTEDGDISVIASASDMFDINAEFMSLSPHHDEEVLFVEDAVAVEMQFAADLLMIQDSAMITDS